MKKSLHYALCAMHFAGLRSALCALRSALLPSALCALLSAVLVFPAFAAMEKHEDVAQDPQGNVIASATVTVYSAGTASVVSIFSDEGVTVKANPTTTDTAGRYWFYAADGDYDIRIVKAGYTTQYRYDVSLGRNKPSGIRYSSEFVSLNAAVTAMTTTSTLIVHSTIPVTSTVTTPTHLSINVASPGVISQGSNTLTISGPFASGIYSAFSGTGLVLFRQGSVHGVRPQWWTTNGFQSALNTGVLSGVPIMISGEVSSGSVTIPAYNSGSGQGSVSILGDSINAINSAGAGTLTNFAPSSRLISTAGSQTFISIAANLGVTKVFFKDLLVLGPDYISGSTSGDGIDLTGTATSVIFDNLFVNGFRGTDKAGVRIKYGFYNHINNSHFNLNNYGLYVDGTIAGTPSWNVSTLSNSIFKHNVFGAKIIGASSLTGNSNLFENNEKSGLELSGCLNHIWMGTYFEANNYTDSAGEYALKISGPVSGVNQHITFLNTHISPSSVTPSTNRIYIGGSGGSLDTRLLGGYANGASTAGTKLITIDGNATDTMIDHFDDDADPLYGISDAGIRTTVKSYGDAYYYSGSLVGPVFSRNVGGVDVFRINQGGLILSQEPPSISLYTVITISSPVTFVSGTFPVEAILVSSPGASWSSKITLVSAGAVTLTASAGPGHFSRSVTFVNRALSLIYDTLTALWYPEGQ